MILPFGPLETPHGPLAVLEPHFENNHCFKLHINIVINRVAVATGAFKARFKLTCTF